MEIKGIQTISEIELIDLGYSKNQSRNLIKQCKVELVQRGFDVYKNKKLLRVPLSEIEKLLGV